MALSRYVPTTDPTRRPAGRATSIYQALTLWAGSRLGIVLLSVVGAGVLMADDPKPLLERWHAWDADLLIVIAEYGYDGDPGGRPDPGLPAFFPGMPAMLRLVHLVVTDWTLCGLLISLVAGAVAMVALVRLGDLEGPPGAGRRAVLLLLLAPTAVFLFAGYSEALFLAFAVPAWLAARRGNWLAAGLLGAGASCMRITGLFLALALIVEYATGPWRRERGEIFGPYRTNPGWLLAPFVPLVAYSAYQARRTGDWLAWNHAQEAGWGRSLVWPWESLATTWGSATAGDYIWAFRLEIAGAAVGVLLVLWLLYRRRWGELVYVGLQVGALLCSAYYLSIPRSALLWWPLWIVLARAGTPREGETGWKAALRPGVVTVYGLVAGPLMVLNTLTFLDGGWAG